MTHTCNTSDINSQSTPDDQCILIGNDAANANIFHYAAYRMGALEPEPEGPWCWVFIFPLTHFKEDDQNHHHLMWGVVYSLNRRSEYIHIYIYLYTSCSTYAGSSHTLHRKMHTLSLLANFRGRDIKRNLPRGCTAMWRPFLMTYSSEYIFHFDRLGYHLHFSSSCCSPQFRGSQKFRGT